MAAPIPPSGNDPSTDATSQKDRDYRSFKERLHLFINIWGLRLVFLLFGAMVLLVIWFTASAWLILPQLHPAGLPPQVEPDASSVPSPSTPAETAVNNLPGDVLPTLTPSATALTTTPALAIPVLPANPFQNTVVDGGPKAGLNPSLAIMQSGEAAIAYFDDKLDALKLVMQSGGIWNKPVVVPVGMGMYSSLKFNRLDQARISFSLPTKNELIFATLNGTQWKFETVAEGVEVNGTVLAITAEDLPSIAFIDLRKNKLRFASKSNGKWKVTDLYDISSTNAEYKAHFALALDSSGAPHLLFNDPLSHLVYASRKSNGTWTFDQIGSVKGTAQPSLVFDAKDRPHAVYGDSQALKFAAFDGQHWVTSTIASFPALYTTLAFDPKGGSFHVAAYNAKSQRLIYAVLLPSGWAMLPIQQLSDSGSSPSLALTTSGLPRISYYDRDTRNLLFAWADTPGFAKETNQSPTPEILNAFNRSGQTFLTWQERVEMQGEIYHIYRSPRPIDPSAFSTWTLLGETGKYSDRFFVGSFHQMGDETHFTTRYSDTLIIQDNGNPLARGTGLFVWTLSPADFSGKASGLGYYAVTVTPPGGQEMLLAATKAALRESAGDPLPVEITITSISQANYFPGEHVYLQYMDFKNWNPTFHAPNPSNNYYGLAPSDPNLKYVVQYAYDYVVYEPTAKMCGGKLPANLPVYFFLHGWKGNRYEEMGKNLFPFCAYGIYPFDQSETWYFGFARDHDYRLGREVEAGDVIVNYTEQRLLRMLFDLERRPPGPPVDKQRIYVFGNSMGGSGSLTLSMRYPNVFAAGYSSQPITNYITAGKTQMEWVVDTAIKWGRPELNLKIALDAPNGWAAALKAKYAGKVGVWDWQNAFAALERRPADDMALFSLDLGIPDSVIPWATQGKPLFELLDHSLRAWGGAVTNTDHEWSNFKVIPPWMRVINGAPFWGLQVVRDESVPAFSNLSGNPPLPPLAPGRFNSTVLWSASWNPWDGAPVDTQKEWRISLCSVSEGSSKCGSGVEQMVTVTPRRLQQFKIFPGARYTYTVATLDGKVLASGTLTADANGLVSVPDVHVRPEGVRVQIIPGKP